MRILLTIFLLSGSGFVISSCRTVYKNLDPVAGHSIEELDQFRPAFGVGLYKASVDVTGRHLSGLVVIKKMPDSSIRIAFTSETGPTFFDFSWPAQGDFKVQSIIPQLNKKAIIKTLRKDFELVLMNRLVQGGFEVAEKDENRWYIFERPKGFDAYVTNKQLTSLMWMERSSKKKTIVEAETLLDKNGIPDSVIITHQQFVFRIELTKIKRNAEE